MSNDRESEIIDSPSSEFTNFVNTDKFAEQVNNLKILCTNNGISEYIFNKLSNVADAFTDEEDEYLIDDKVLLEILENVCPKNISDVCKLFDVYSESTNNYKNIKEYCEYCDLIFSCINASIISIDEILENGDNYHNFHDWLITQEFDEYDTNIPYTYFNTVKTNAPRATTNDEKKNVLTLKIKNEDLKDDLLTINLLLRIPDPSKKEYLLHIKAHVVNDSYDIIRNDHVFRKYFNIDRSYALYNKIHLRDCCLNSLNGMDPLSYITKVYELIGTCNDLCTPSTNPHLDININTKNETSGLSNSHTQCTESTHFIQKFAKFCFHTKYLIILYSAEHRPDVCVFLSVILVRCNNRLCREFLDTLPDLIKRMILASSGIGNLDESKTDTNLVEKIGLLQRINIWKQLFGSKYGMNVKKLIEKASELCAEDDKNNSPFSENAEKDRLKKMISNFEKISIRIHLLKIHSQLINLIDKARVLYPDKMISSIHDVIIARQNDTSIKRQFNLQEITEKSPIFDQELANYLNNFVEFERKIRERILHISEGQMSIKKAIWQYIMDVVSNYNPLATRKILCLIGPPGVGKTFISLCIARILFFEPDEKPSELDIKNLVHIISIPSITNENGLLGSNAVYVSARPGIITKEALFNDYLFRKLIVYDEIDKKCNFIDQLLPVLDYTQNSKIVDNYFDVEVDLRTVFQIATANDKNLINPILRDRMHIIELNGYSTYTKCNIVKSQMLGQLLTERGLDKNLIKIPLPVIKNIILTRTREAGVRKLKNILIDIISAVNLAITTNMVFVTANLNKFTMSSIIDDEEALTGNITNKKINAEYYAYSEFNIKELYNNIVKRYLHHIYDNNNSIILTKADIDIILADKTKITLEKISDVTDWGPGKIIGLYATTMGVGGILPIVMKFNKTHVKKGMLVTLGAQKTMKDSAMISNILTTDYLSKLDNKIFNSYLGIDKELFIERVKHISNTSALHVLLDSSISKDGPSAGGAFVISHMSKILGHTLTNKMGITGEISNNFKITAIGGINMKVNGALYAGCRGVIAPTQNINNIYNELVNQNSIDVENKLGERCAFVYYSEYDKCFILLIRAKPSDILDNNLSTFDINITSGTYKQLTTFTDDVPSLFKYKLKTITKESDLINPKKGLDVELVKDGRKKPYTLRKLMTEYFTIFALENIPQIYYLMVMAKHVYNPELCSEYTNIIDTIKDVEFDGVELSDKSIEKIKEESDEKTQDE